MKRTFLVLAFCGLFVIPECNPCRCPDISGEEFFDIEGIEIGHIRSSGGFIDTDQPIARSEYGGIALSLETEYVAHTVLPSYSLFTSSAFACSCPDPGWLGAATESFESIVITTVNDFDEDIRAGDTITDLFLIRYDLDTLSISEFLEADTGTVRQERYNMTLTADPQNDSLGFAAEVRVMLSNGESYKDTSTPVFFQ